MQSPRINPLLDPPLFPADHYALLADRIKRLLSTRSDVLLIQAEAILALEAAAASIARPGLVAVNIVSSPYGSYFGAWLRRGGATVHEVLAEPGQPVAVAAVTAALATLPQIDVLAVVHGEAANGALNPLSEITALAKARGALVVVDAVASVGAHPLDVDALGIDIAAIGPQKALGGPVGLSAISVSPRAWQEMAGAPRLSPSSLSLLDLKETWLDKGRGQLPGTPPPLEFWALEAALDRVEEEGIANLIFRHQQAAVASRAGLRALGVAPWIADDRAASALITAAPVPPGIDQDELIKTAAMLGVTLGRGFGDISSRLVRLDHTGTRAAFSSVLANVITYGAALAKFGVIVDLGAAAEAVARVYAK